MTELADSQLLKALAEMGFGLHATEGDRLVYANQAFADQTGYTVSELRALPPDAILGLEADGSGIVRKDGLRVSLEVASHVLLIEGRPLRVIVTRALKAGSLPDLVSGEAALIRAKEDAQRASQAKSEFLATMSHDIRTPMHAMLGIADVLWESTLSDEQRDLVGILRRSGEALSALLNDILDLSRVEAARVQIATERFDVRELIDQVIALFEPQARQKGLRLEAAVAADLPRRMLGDVLRLSQILCNLVGNAVKFTDRGRIGLTVEGSDGELRIAVADTGIGIAPEHHATLFDRFTQGPGSRAWGGTGLGLAIVRRMTELLGGKVKLESELGRGSTFLVSLPIQPSDAADPAPDREPTAPGEIRPLRLLLVEDCAENRQLMEILLKHSPHRLEVVEDGAAAFERFAGGGFDAVLMDLQMPGIDGYEATRRIRALECSEGRAPTPIIALTAHAFAEDARRSAEAGCDRHVAKPLRRSTLLNLLAEIGSPRNPLVVEVAAELEERVPEFLHNRRRELTVLSAAAVRQDFPEIRRIGHDLKGLGGGYGFEGLSELGARLEVAARQQDARAVADGLAEYAACLSRLQVRYV